MIRGRTLCTALVVLAVLGGCASYRPRPLARRPALAPRLADLDLTLPQIGGRGAAQRIDIARPLTIDQIGLLAILNNPGLRSEPGEIGVARGKLLTATLLPNPSANFAYGALLGGPGTTASITASLSQDIAAIVVHTARVRSALAGTYQVDADLLWREWQVAQKARQLAADIYAADRAIALTRRELRLISGVLAQVRKAVAAGNLTIAALAPLLTAEAAAEQSLITQRLAQLKDWQALDALLGLLPSVRFAIARPVFGPLPRDLDRLAASLPQRRPDLIALRFGYDSAEENVRAAILGQFPTFTLGAAGGKDTTGVISAGPSFTFALPIFDRNQGAIAETRATRLLLREQYQDRLDTALGTVRALVAQLDRLSADLGEARKAAAAAGSLAATARRAYAQGNLDQRSLTDYETTALERALEVVTIERQRDEDRIFLAVELGLGLPETRIAPSAPARGERL
ncbi:MAG TPA: TolC family protein [Stellaceae bacterium]|nr:TolC family protein [Stellaceae bacterium]